VAPQRLIDVPGQFPGADARTHWVAQGISGATTHPEEAVETSSGVFQEATGPEVVPRIAKKVEGIAALDPPPKQFLDRPICHREG
jgi:hypothetical protein